MNEQRPPFSDTTADTDTPPTYDALLADRDGWKQLADERWRIIADLAPGYWNQ